MVGTLLRRDIAPTTQVLSHKVLFALNHHFPTLAHEMFIGGAAADFEELTDDLADLLVVGVVVEVEVLEEEFGVLTELPGLHCVSTNEILNVHLLKSRSLWP